MGEYTDKLIAGVFSNKVPYRPQAPGVPTGRVTNPNAKKLGKGKTAKSKKRLMREAQMQMQQPQMSFAEQQQLQNDQFKFLQDNIFGRTGATRRTIGGQLEQDVPQGMDFFKNTGPDRQSVKDRQARLDSTSLNQPGVWNQAQQAVNDAKRAQGWSDPNTPPAQPPGPSMDQMLRRDNGAVGYFNDPAYNSINPRTGLVTNDGPFNLSRDTPYGPARSYFEGSKGNISKEPAKVPNAGPVQQLFTPQPTMNRMDPASAISGPPANQQTAPMPIVQPPAQPQFDTSGIFGAPNLQWSDMVPSWPASSPMGGYQQPQAPMQTAQQPQQPAYAPNMFGAPNFSWGQLGEAFNFNNPKAWINDPFNRAK